MTQENNQGEAQVSSQGLNMTQIEKTIKDDDNTKITIDDYAKVEIKIGKILSADIIENADKLLKLSVDFAESAPRTIVSGIRKFYPEPSKLVGVKCCFCTNLQPRKLKGLESNGMILAASSTVPDENGDNVDNFTLLQVPENIPVGTKIK